jgi:hypothetical protein
MRLWPIANGLYETTFSVDSIFAVHFKGAENFRQKQSIGVRVEFSGKISLILC